MLNFLSKKEKRIVGLVTLIGICGVISKYAYEYSTYKILKSIDRQFKKNSWDYYE